MTRWRERFSDPRQKRLLSEQATHEGKWWALWSLVRSGILNELMRHKPTPEELASVEGTLKDEDRRRLERAPPDMRGRYLMFLVQQRKFPALKEYMEQMFRREGWGGRFPGGPGGPGREGGPRDGAPRGDGGPRGEGGRPPGPGFGPGEGGRGFDKDRGPEGERRRGGLTEVVLREGPVSGRREARSETVHSGIVDQEKGMIARHLRHEKTIPLRLVLNETTEVGRV